MDFQSIRAAWKTLTFKQKLVVIFFVLIIIFVFYELVMTWQYYVPASSTPIP